MKSNADHVNKRNYDDFNEFFWSRECLRYRYSCVDPNKFDAEDPSRITAPLPGEVQPPITVGLLNAPKTFLEKRSWLRGIMALSRIVEWHIVTFYLLSVLAFSHGGSRCCCVSSFRSLFFHCFNHQSQTCYSYHI